VFSSTILPFRTIDFSNPADKTPHDKIVSLVEQMLSAKPQTGRRAKRQG
jgi:hypothetical protein